MSFDWQTVAVALIIAGALLYVARRAFARLRSFRAAKGGGCSTGCGSCGEVDAPIRASQTLVQVGGSKADRGARR